MSVTCAKCSRVNPDEAVYCYFDGMVLNGHGGPAGPVATGSQPFHSPFVFPSGRTCRSFDELAMACQEEWGPARSLMLEGHLGAFFGGLGRADLALAAREAARYPDPDRGLDQLLASLPSTVLDPPKLHCTPQEINLGVLDNASERAFDLHLENKGMRLLYGSVSVGDCPWLCLGDPPGVAQQLFDFRHETTVPVHVRKDRLRAGNKPFAAKVYVESNGGVQPVVVKAELPIKPFPTGVLAGALSPRQVAERSKEKPREAALLFESGAVEEWYRSNGWTYPVKIPAASGMAAVQQFFEALGLTKPPRVSLDRQEITLQGSPGESQRFEINVSTEEKRPVFAHASSNQPWLEVSRARLNGRIATIGVSIPSVPRRPGETLTAQLVVVSNGNQRFVLPVTLSVPFSLDDPEPMVVEEVPALVFEEPVPPAAQAASPLDFTAAPPRKETSLEDLDLAPPKPTRRSRAAESRPWLHALPALGLGLALLAVVLVEWFSDGLGGPRDNRLYLRPQFDAETMRFTLELPLEKGDDGQPKLLIYQDTRSGRPLGTNTVVLIDEPIDKDDPEGWRRGGHYFGGRSPLNNWVTKREDLPTGRGSVSTMDFQNKAIQVKQHVEVVRGPTELYDTCLIWYTVKNNDSRPHQVGLRLLLDTYIGGNDGVPFLIPGRKGFMTTKEELGGKEIPSYIEAVEKPDDPDDPGTVARLGLKGVPLPTGAPEEVDGLVVARFPHDHGGANVKWQWPLQSMGKGRREDDSCVAVYWAYRSMAPGEERHMAVTYGLSELSVGEGGEGSKLAFSNPGYVAPNSEFDVVVYVYGARSGQTVKLELPRGLSLAAGEQEEKAVEAGGSRSKVVWRVKAGAEGTYEIKAGSGPARARPIKVKVQSRSIFG